MYVLFHITLFGAFKEKGCTWPGNGSLMFSVARGSGSLASLDVGNCDRPTLERFGQKEIWEGRNLDRKKFGKE